MSQYTALITWNRDNAVFTDNKYSRGHRIAFDGGIAIPASSSAHVVPFPYSVAEAVDPEEAFVASLSSCHMLSFLWVAMKKGFVVDSYRDEAVGILAKDGRGTMAMTSVTLHPIVAFSGARRPTAEEHDALHHEAHTECYIANSVLTEVRCEATDASVTGQESPP